MEMKITLAQYRKLPLMNAYFPKSRKDLHPTKKDYETAFLSMCTKKGVEWKEKMLSSFKTESENAKRRREQIIQNERKRFMLRFNIGDKIVFKRKKLAITEFGTITVVHSPYNLTVDLAQTRPSKKSVDEKGVFKPRPCFNKQPRCTERVEKFFKIFKM